MLRRLPTPSLSRPRCSRQLGALLAALLVWGAGSLGLLRSLDGLLYDALFRLSTGATTRPPRVLLVEVREGLDDPEGEAYTRIVDRLENLGARDILFTFTPRGLSRSFWEGMAGRGSVAFGRELIVDPFDARRTRLDPLPPEAAGLDLRFALSHIEPADHGIHRSQRSWTRVQDRPFLALEALPLSRAETGAALASDGRFSIDFAGGPGSLPTVGFESVLEDRLIPELVRGMAVLVGEVDARHRSWLETPVTTPARKMSPLELHGHALQTLLGGTAIEAMDRRASLGWLLAVAGVLSTILLWSEAGLAAWITAGSGALTLGAGYLALSALRLWPPVLELLLTEGLILAATLREKAVISSAAMSSLLLAVSSHSRSRVIRHEGAEASECWSLLINFIHQTLELNRLVFFETVPGSRILREAQSLNCSFADVGERRRDYGRAPYNTAAEAGRPIRVESFLKKAFHREEQYIVALSFGGELLGFWAFGVEASRASSVAMFDEVISTYADSISELLYRRRRDARPSSLPRKVRDILTRERTEELHEELKTLLEKENDQARRVEALLSGIQTATIVHDLFGRLVHANDGMLALLEAEKLDPRRLSALDLLSALGEYDLTRSRTILRHVVLEGQAITVPASLASRPESRFILHLHPLRVADEDAPDREGVDLFGRNILCELVDTTSFTGLYEMKEKLASRLGLQLRNDLASIDLSSSLLSQSELSGNQREHISQIIHDKVARTMDVLVECQQYLTMEGESGSIERFPVDAREALESAARALGPAAARRDVKIQVRQPKLMSYVLASSESLEQAFRAILALLVGDATDGSVVSVVATESDDLVTYRFENVGFGIPDERFQEYLFGDKTLASAELKVLRESIGRVEAWGGELQLRSEVGTGIRSVLSLVKFL